jgi:hypothetical protein
VLIWKDVCANKLLAGVELVLFLNKCDLLERKLAAGVRLAKYVRSYGERANDIESASKCASAHRGGERAAADGLARRLPEQVQRDPARVLAEPAQVLRVLHVGDGLRLSRLCREPRD